MWADIGERQEPYGATTGLVIPVLDNSVGKAAHIIRAIGIGFIVGMES